MIPPVAHFVWLNEDLPWVYALGIRSAALRGGFERVVVHHGGISDTTPGGRMLEATENVESRRLDPPALFERTGAHGPALIELYNRLDWPASKANMIRAALLATEGGVYLDTDTITVASLTPLRETGVFCGAERIAYPVEVTQSGHPLRWMKAHWHLIVRDVYRRKADGWRAFRRIEDRFPAAVNNAVLGATPGHPFIAGMLSRMVALPPKKQVVRYALGTTLLQNAVAAYEGEDLTVHPPRAFYPLPPEISEHWFKETDRPSPEEVLYPDTRVVHWYASVRTRTIVPRISPDYVRAHAGNQLFSALVLPLLD